MEIDDKGLPIHKDATAKIRPRIFLEGNFFVDLQPGTPSAPTIDDGDTLPVTQTAGPVQLDQVLTALQQDTRKEPAAAARGLGSGADAQADGGRTTPTPTRRPAAQTAARVAERRRSRYGADRAARHGEVNERCSGSRAATTSRELIRGPRTGRPRA